MSNLLIVWADSPSAQGVGGVRRGREREREEPRQGRQAGCIAGRPLLSAARGPGGVGVCFPLFGIHPPAPSHVAPRPPALRSTALAPARPKGERVCAGAVFGITLSDR
jgi:hypothetical protein